MMTMKKVGIFIGVVVLVGFVTSSNVVYGVQIETIYTAASSYEDTRPPKEIHFEPGGAVHIHFEVMLHRNQQIKLKIYIIVYNPSDVIIEEFSASFSEYKNENLDRCRYPRSVHFVLPYSAPTGEYTIKAIIHNEIDDSQETVELTFYVDYYTAKEYLEIADSNFADGYYEDARTYYELAEKEYEKYRAYDELYYCGKRMEECKYYKQAEEYYLKAEKYLKEKDYRSAYTDFMLSRNYYVVLGDEDLMQQCDSCIKECENYMQAEEYYLKAEQCLREKNYLDAVYNFTMAKNLFEELGEIDSAEVCNYKIRDNSGIRFFTKELLEIPSVTNLSIITWVGCIYILYRESKKAKIRKILMISSLAVIVISSVFFIEYYFRNSYYVFLFLVNASFGALALGILLKRYRKKVYPNPYIAGNPIRSREIFFGRKDIFKFIKDKLKSQKNATIVLHGERRTGKTSILYQVENGELGEEFLPVYMDMQEMARVNEIEFFAKITEKIVESLTRNGILDFASTSCLGIDELAEEYKDESNPYQVFNRFLDILSHVLKEKYLILMFDEYEILEKKIQNNQLSSDIIHYLRNQMQSREKISFIFAGSRKLEELEAKNWSLMFNAAVYKKISFLEKEDAINLITVPVAVQIYYTDEAINKILRLTACHPYFLQLFLQNIIDHMNDIEKREVTEKEVTHVLQYLLDNPAPHMIYIWQDSTDEQNMILSALSEIIETEEEYISVKRIEETLSHNGVKCDTDSIKKTLRVLYQRELIDYNNTGYSFKIDLLRHWIKTEHPLFKILEEIPRTRTPIE